ncbi:MAG: PAS domain-containing protein [Bacteroidetes bacterium]|nr:PAS domain-containing protein [Bacteroidota bacterium]
MATQTESKQSIEKTVISFLASFECAFFSLDYEGKIDSFNQAALDLFNVPYEDLLGKPFAGLLSSGHDHIEFAIKESVSGNKVTEMDRFFSGDGKMVTNKNLPTGKFQQPVNKRYYTCQTSNALRRTGAGSVCVECLWSRNAGCS